MVVATRAAALWQLPLLVAVALLRLDAASAQGASAVNSFLRSAVKGSAGLKNSQQQACFWTELAHNAFEPADGASHPPFDQSFATLQAAKAACVEEPTCRAVSQRLGEGGDAATGDGSFLLSDQRAATPVHGASSWVRECEVQEPVQADDAAMSPAAMGSGVAARSGSATDSTTEFFTIKVLTMDRLQSLKRLIDSLKDAYYDGDTVHIQFFVDFPPAKDPAKLAQKLNARRLIIDHLETWDWPYGTKTIHVRVHNGGLIGQWLEAWWPNSDSQAAVVLEDDLSVSKFYYRWCKKAIAKYLWDPANFDPHVFGISLQRQYLVPMKASHHSVSVPGNCPYKYQLIGSWGQIFFPQAWRDFRRWFEELPKDFHPLVDGLVTSDWYAALWKTTAPWTMHIIRWAAEKSMYNLYTNFEGKSSICANYREPGLHFHGKAQGADTKIITSWDASKDECFPDSADLPIYDFSFNTVGSYTDLNNRYTYNKKLSDY